MRLRRLCLEIFALRLFLREPIQIFRFAISIQPSNALRCNSVLCPSESSVLQHQSPKENRRTAFEREVAIYDRQCPDSLDVELNCLLL